VSQKGRLRRIDAGLDWLETEGRYRRIRNMIKVQEMAQKFADRVAADPAYVAKVKKDLPIFFAYMSRLSAGLRPPGPPEPEPAPPVLPILRDAAVPAAPQDEESADRSTSTDLTLRSERSERLEGSEPAPPPAAPPAIEQRPQPPPPDMEIRPVRWRPRGERDYDYDEEERPGTNGRCITEYDPLREEDDDDDG